MASRTNMCRLQRTLPNEGTYQYWRNIVTHYLISKYIDYQTEQEHLKAIPLPDDNKFMVKVDEYIRNIQPNCGKIIVSEREMLSDTYIVKETPYTHFEQYITFFFKHDVISEKKDAEGNLERERVDFVRAKTIMNRLKKNNNE